MLTTSNLRLLATFLQDDAQNGASARSAEACAGSASMSKSSCRTKSTSSEELDLPPLIAGGAADAHPAKLQRRSQSGRALSAFNVLAAASARKAALCKIGV